ncbi:uncharacterized protein LOC125048722 isoform X2 [Pieris napi]|uniref:uncharacterized protein LOC125048722 isoform X2 n=1 Tax=Pieris napi TaxID=78633 RepID=UPI001FB8F7B3|nr:uncharacterized protein LOC125048722 isoform X2 [Pieris napi]
MARMWIVCFVAFCLFQNAVGFEQHFQFCNNNTKVRSCTPQILGEGNSDDDSCKLEIIPPNSSDCVDSFGPIENNAHIGGVSLHPYILPVEVKTRTEYHSNNYTVLNITFSNIKWKTMKFRFQKYNKKESHCRNIVISNDVTFNEQSVLYYDCYWSLTDGDYNGQSHILDFEATDDYVVNRGRYYFNIPSAQMLSPTISEKDWKPFVYIEILTPTMNLHIIPPPAQLKIHSYQIDVMKQCDHKDQCEELVKTAIIKVKNSSREVTYTYSLLNSPGLYYFKVTPQHQKCKGQMSECQFVESPRITIKNEVHQAMNICIASITALILATLFIYYIVLRVIRRYWCKEYGQEIPPPTKVLIIYPTASRLHAECVTSFVTYLRAEYGFDIMYDGDISTTSHGDPYIWAEEAFKLASHIVYVVGPAEDTNLYNNIYDKPIITAHKVDILLLSLLRSTKTSKLKKYVVNVFFEHSDGDIPVETRNDRVFFLIKDWQKFIAYLSRNLLPRKQLMRTEKGKCFLDDLSRAKKLLSNSRDDHIIKFDKNCVEKKVVL